MSGRSVTGSQTPNHAGHAGNTENPGFELAPFPPWDSSASKNDESTRSLNTPLRRPNRRTKNHDSPVVQDKFVDLSKDESGYDKIEYNYHPFTKKNLISQSKIDNLLKAEQAEHCLIFHKDGHMNNMDNFRPDIEVDCEDQNAGGDILIDYPDKVRDTLAKEDSSLYSGSRKSRDYMEHHRHSRSAKSTNKLHELKSFLQNSKLLNYIDTNIIIKQNEILSKDTEDIARIKNELRSKPSGSLKERCDRILKNRTYRRKN